jgi:glycine/D-amino acid oxidase-like deaminating enzyme
MRVGVLGGGLQGCCTALALAERGFSVTLFDRNDALLSRTAVANEGKIHLGYMYVGDPTLATARTMMQGALAFAPFLRRHLGRSSPALTISAPTTYVVHRDSQHSAEEISAYIAEVHRLILQAARGREFDYFGLDLGKAPRPWSNDERNAVFNPEVVIAAFDTPEVAINPVELAGGIERCIDDHPLIEMRLGRNIVGVHRDGDALQVASDGRDGRCDEAFDHIVNALWDGRLAVDRTIGLMPKRPWLHRLKYGVTFTWPSDIRSPASATIVSGPFGEMVSFPNGFTYLTWYPEGLQGISADVTPPDWQTYPAEPLRSQVLNGTIAALSGIVPGLRALNVTDLADVRVKGGVIVAWGKTDIYDPQSELHRRYEIGVTSAGNYHSIDPGKLTMAPYFAAQCAAQIAASTV